MIANGGRVDVTLPAQLKPGKYLVRQELLALHMADTRGDQNPARGAELYPSCVQVDVVGGGGAATPDQNFDFNTGYKYDDKGIFFNIYVPFDTYTPPGPRVWTPK
jgi:cellulase